MAWTEWVDSVDTNEVPRNLRLLMAVRHLTDQLWIDESSLAPFLQTSRQEASGLLGPSRRTHDGRSTHNGSSCRNSVGQHARVSPHIDCDQLAGGGLSQAGRERPLPPWGGVARSYAQHRGRISTTELASIVDAAPSNVGTHLKELESEGVLIPSSPTRAGRGFHYVWAEESR